MLSINMSKPEPLPAGAPLEVQNLARLCHETLILAVLGTGRKHGYQVALEAEERSGGFFTFNNGTLYPALYRLEQEGLVEGTWSEGDGRRKREYALTAAGRERLATRLEQWQTFWERFSTVVGGDIDERGAAAAV
jgi:PadR family transcriptional regulator, regulatory protein PadR